jgi:hypothetical protein
MRISLYVGTSEVAVLCHGTQRGVGLHSGPADDHRGNIRALAQVDPIIGGTSVTIQDRGNKQGRESFTVSVELASMEAAFLYTKTYAYGLPRFGEIRFVEGAQTVKLVNAHIEDVSYRQHGVSVDLTYSITFGAVS